ncbi:MAG: hypothetical protein LBH97_07425 [Treponema sp.]|jgi:chromosome segregation ATPase|nr:hypothetical protein [Treponema sp.]
MTNNDEIVFDESSGISAEEQRDILSKINGIAEKNRRSLSEAALSETKGTQRFSAKKSGGFFPVLVNVIALALLAGGFFLLSFFQGKTETQVREGTKVYNSAERALIDEIRKETASRIEAKENEIALVISKLEGVDAELQELQSNTEGLTAEQRTTENRLRSMQEEYRSALAALQDERSRILEASRAREAELYAQLEARSRELAAVSGQSAAALSLARGELERISAEQIQAANVEAQLAAFFANLTDHIREDRLDEAAGTIQAMRDFLNTPAFQSLRSIQARKELYNQSINSFAVMVEEARKNQTALALAGGASAGGTEKTISDLQAENALLKENMASLTSTVEAVSSQGSGLADQVTTLRNQNSTLQRQNTELQTGTTERDRRISALETEETTLRQTIGDLQQQGAAKDETITSLTNQLAQIRQALQALSE